RRSFRNWARGVLCSSGAREYLRNLRGAQRSRRLFRRRRGRVRFTEINLFGVYVAPMALMMIAAWFITIALRRAADRFGLLRHVWPPAPSRRLDRRSCRGWWAAPQAAKRAGRARPHGPRLPGEPLPASGLSHAAGRRHELVEAKFVKKTLLHHESIGHHHPNPLAAIAQENHREGPVASTFLTKSALLRHPAAAPRWRLPNLREKL